MKNTGDARGSRLFGKFCKRDPKLKTEVLYLLSTQGGVSTAITHPFGL